MLPRLFAITGPVKGAVFPLECDEWRMGRDPASDLCLDDPGVSRRHCLLIRQDGRFRIRDLDSRNGTFVNGTPIQERVLQPGDEIRIGASLLFFLIEEERDAARPAAAAWNESDAATRSILLRPEDSVYLRPGKLEGLATLGERRSRELRVLLDLSSGIHSGGRMEDLAGRLLGSIFEALPAERGGIVLLSDDGSWQPAFGWARDSGRAAASPAPAALLERALSERATLLSEPGPGGLPSLLVAPLLASGRAWGAITLETAAQAAPFDADHLQLLTALAAIAAGPLENAQRLEWLESENRRLQVEVHGKHSMIGETPVMQEVFQQIARAAPSESTILIQGETGTGKELVARAIHAGSRRSARSFVAVNCANLSEALLESDLFGHEKGAFTGAIAQKRGKLELAEGGTLFLDEVGEMTSPLQAKLLRFLQEREFERVGGTRTLRADVRVIAATNRDLTAASQTGAFRHDLYFRLNVICLTLPPLRERRADIPLLASHFLVRLGEKSSRPIAGISPGARACLLSYDWPGNIRELENALERAVVLGSGDQIQPEDLPEPVFEGAAVAAAGAGFFHESVRDAKRRLILAALDQAGGSQLQAAKILGLNPTYLSRLIRNLELKPALKTGAGQ